MTTQFEGAAPNFSAAFRKIAPDAAARFEADGVRYTTHMPDESDTKSGQGRSWRSTLSVDSVAGAEHRLSELGYSWEWQPDGALVTTSAALPAIRTPSSPSC